MNKDQEELQAMRERLIADSKRLTEREQALIESEKTQGKQLIQAAVAAKEEAKEMASEPSIQIKADETACPNCGTMISKDATVCYACGTELKKEAAAEAAPAEEKAAPSGGDEEVACPSCGTMVSKGASVCYACGAGIPSAAAATETPVEVKKPPVFVKKVMKKKIV
jgi:RNA polymerase subunit RPABC4/transcription elongation factor Spt4